VGRRERKRTEWVWRGWYVFPCVRMIYLEAEGAGAHTIAGRSLHQSTLIFTSNIPPPVAFRSSTAAIICGCKEGGALGDSGVGKQGERRRGGGGRVVMGGSDGLLGGDTDEDLAKCGWQIIGGWQGRDEAASAGAGHAV
jgi:hypothetical protein